MQKMHLYFVLSSCGGAGGRATNGGRKLGGENATPASRLCRPSAIPQLYVPRVPGMPTGMWKYPNDFGLEYEVSTCMAHEALHRNLCMYGPACLLRTRLLFV